MSTSVSREGRKVGWAIWLFVLSSTRTFKGNSNKLQHFKDGAKINSTISRKFP
jgi:hypothetical protein